MLKVVTLVEIGQETGLLWMPAKALLGQGAGRWTVKAEEASEKAEVSVSFAEWHRDNRKSEVTTYDACNVTHWDAFIANGVKLCPCWCAFQCQAEQTRRVEAMHRRPAIHSIARIPRHAL